MAVIRFLGIGIERVQIEEKNTHTYIIRFYVVYFFFVNANLFSFLCVSNLNDWNNTAHVHFLSVLKQKQPQ